MTSVRGPRLLGLSLLLESRVHLVLPLGRESRLAVRPCNRLAQPVCSYSYSACVCQGFSYSGRVSMMVYWPLFCVLP